MPRMVFLFLLFSLLSCIENPSGQSFTERQIMPMESFLPLINQKPLKNTGVDLDEDISLINNEYPVEIWLYKNNKYFYELPNLGSGLGSWIYEDGLIIMTNEHHIKTIDIKINMKYRLYLSTKSKVRLEFSDRFGINNIELEKISY